MNRTVFRHHYFAAGSLILASLMGMGGMDPNAAKGPNQGHYAVTIDIGFPVKTFIAAFVDKDNTKWFLTEQGVVSFNGEKWILHNMNKKIAAQDLKDIAYEVNTHENEVWIASPKGASVASLPVDARTGATTYHTENSTILSNNVLRIAVGKSPLRWFGTDKGVSAFRSDRWLTPSYEGLYPQTMFQDFPITSMATNPSGDSLYVGTQGAGIVRVFRDDVDGISGASAYSQWGPILLPSDNINCIFIAPDGNQWFGTDMGVSLHIGHNTLEDWTVYNTDNGLVNDFVQAIAGDGKGKIWIGTRGGVSVFDGKEWKSYTTSEGLNSNNIRCIIADNDGVVWLGTDDGVNSYNNGVFASYR